VSAYFASPALNDAVVVVQNGSFEFPRVAAGNYVILAPDPSRTGRPVGRYDLTVSESDVDSVLISLGPGATIEGRFKMESNEPVPASVRFSLRSADATRINVGAAPDPKDAVLRATGILPGRYWVDFSGGLPTDAYVKTIHFGDFDATYQPIEVRGGAQPALQVVVSPNGGTVAGTVRSTKGEAVSASQVILAPASPALADIARLVKGPVPGPQGYFRFRGVAPGEYVLLALEDVEAGAVRDPAFRAAIAEKGVKVAVQEGSNLTLDVPLIPSSVTAAELAKLP